MHNKKIIEEIVQGLSELKEFDLKTKKWKNKINSDDKFRLGKLGIKIICTEKGEPIKAVRK